MRPLPESLFSVQFVPPYAIALVARLFGVSASTAFIALVGLAALFAALAIYWLLLAVTGDEKLAAVGCVFVFCLGALVGGQGLMGALLRPSASFSGLNFLRRYLPATAFPLLFIFFNLTWQALTASLRRTAVTKAVLSGLILAVLIFSYFYFWTAAIAWLFCLVSLWLLYRADERRKTLFVCLLVALPAIVALPFYFYLLSGLPTGVDEAQVLSFGHSPDFWRVPEAASFLLVIPLVVGIRLRRFTRSQPCVLLAASFVMLPFVIFNQQILTGRSIQSYHYEVFVANYAVLVAAVLLVKLYKPTLSNRALVWSACLFLLWGTLEVNFAFSRHVKLDVRNDKTVPVLRHLRGLAKEDGTLVGLQAKGKTPFLVFSPQVEISTMLPTWAPQGTLLGIGSVSFQSLERGARKTALFTHLYYCGRSPEYLRDLLTGKLEDPFLTYYTKSTLYGPERVLGFLGADFRPIATDEIDAEVLSYRVFLDSFSDKDVLRRQLGYAITPADALTDFSRIDLWYERDGGKTIGAYKLYRLKLRQVRNVSIAG